MVTKWHSSDRKSFAIISDYTRIFFFPSWRIRNSLKAWCTVGEVYFYRNNALLYSNYILQKVSVANIIEYVHNSSENLKSLIISKKKGQSNEGFSTWESLYV